MKLYFLICVCFFVIFKVVASVKDNPVLVKRQLEQPSTTPGPDPCDILECIPGEDCVTFAGLTYCYCPEGYLLLQSNPELCIDIDECAVDNGGCDHVCNNIGGSFSCLCFPGFVLQPDGSTCQDHNECATDNGGCDQICNNIDGSFYCSCNPGFVLQPDGFTCQADEVVVFGPVRVCRRFSLTVESDVKFGYANRACNAKGARIAKLMDRMTSTMVDTYLQSIDASYSMEMFWMKTMCHEQGGRVLPAPGSHELNGYLCEFSASIQ